MYELSLFYNCASLQKTLEQFICHHLEELVSSSRWEVSEKALSSLEQNPSYLSQSEQFIGIDAKKMLSNLDIELRLITYCQFLKPEAKSKTWSVDDKLELIVHTEDMLFGSSKDIVYFTYQYELFCISSSPGKNSHRIYRYSQKEKGFSSVMNLGYQHYQSTNHFELPSYLPKLTVKMVMTSILKESIFILFKPTNFQVSGLWLMRLNVGKSGKQAIEHIEKLEVDIDTSNYYCSVYCRNSLYIFNKSKCCIYNFDERSLTNHESEYFLQNYETISLRTQQLQDFEDEDQHYIYRYCQFQDTIYLFTVSSIADKVKVYNLNVDDGTLVYLSEHDVPLISGALLIDCAAVSSQNKLVLALTVALAVSDSFSFIQDEYDTRKVLCHYDPRSRNLISEENNDYGNGYLFVPEYLFT